MLSLNFHLISCMLAIPVPTSQGVWLYYISLRRLRRFCSCRGLFSLTGNLLLLTFTFVDTAAQVTAFTGVSGQIVVQDKVASLLNGEYWVNTRISLPHRRIITSSSIGTLQGISSLHRLVLRLPEPSLHPAAIHLDFPLTVHQHAPVDCEVQNFQTRNLDRLSSLFALLVADRDVA